MLAIYTKIIYHTFFFIKLRNQSLFSETSPFQHFHPSARKVECWTKQIPLAYLCFLERRLMSFKVQSEVLSRLLTGVSVWWMEVRCLRGRNQNCHPTHPPLSACDLDIGSLKHMMMSLFRPWRIYKNGRTNALHNHGSSYVRVRYTHTRGQWIQRYT